MKSTIIAVIGFAVLVIIALKDKSFAALHGGRVYGNPKPILPATNPGDPASLTPGNLQVYGNPKPNLFSTDQKVNINQPDIPPALTSEVAPILVWNPTSVPPPPSSPSGATLPDPAPSGTLSAQSPSDLSPNFWSADSVPTNPFLVNEMGGPTYTK